MKTHGNSINCFRGVMLGLGLLTVGTCEAALKLVPPPKTTSTIVSVPSPGSGGARFYNGRWVYMNRPVGPRLSRPGLPITPHHHLRHHHTQPPHQW